MENAILIGIIFFVTFFIESVFGFGGLVIAFTVLGFFIDIKDAVYLGLYVGIIGSAFIILTDYKSFSKKRFLEIFRVALVGVMFGTFLFDYISSLWLLKIFSGFLFIFSVKNLFFGEYEFESIYIKNMLLFFSGILQGMLGVGGPFSVLAMKKHFVSKSELRTTMAVFFITFNIIRIGQLSLQGEWNYQIIINYYWLALVLGFSVFLGHKLHVKISEKYFTLGINYILLFASIALFIK